MGYVKQTWIDKKTPLDAEHMNHIEEGLEAAHKAISEIEIPESPETLQVDDTLTISGAAADAAAVGKKVTALSEEIADLKGGSDPAMSPNLCNPDTMSTGYVSLSGYHNPDATNYQCTDYIAVTPGDTLHFSTSGEGNKDGVRYVCAYDADKVAQQDKGASHDSSLLSYVVPDGVAYVRLTFYAGVTDIMVNTGDAPLPYVPYGPIGGTTIDEKVAELEEAVFATVTGKNMVNPDAAVQGGLLYDNTISTEGSYANYETSEFIPVKQNADYAFAMYNVTHSYIQESRKMLMLYDSEKQPISNSYQNIAESKTIVFNTGSASYVRVCGGTGRLTSNSDGLVYLQLEAGTEFTGFAEYNPQARKIRNNFPEQTYGKKWVVFGDSFTHGGYNAADGFDASVYKYQSGKYAGKNITYPYIIAERNDMEIVQYFAGGRTLANPADGSFTNSITNPSGNCYYQTIPADADYITIYLGINDSHHESGTSGTDGEDVTGVIQLGTIEDTDVSTFCGAWNVVLPWLMTNRPNAHIGIIVSNGVDRVEYRTATIAAAKKWGIPYLDLNGDERCPAMIRTVNPDISSEAKNILKQKWRVTESNTHPNTAAQYFQSTFIENWLRTL